MASVRNIGLNSQDSKVENEGATAISMMSGDTCSNNFNKTPPKESYWFAHGGVEEQFPKTIQTSSKHATADLKELQIQKDKEERIRVFREQQEEERLKRLKDIEQQFLLAKKHREKQEEERKRRIEEARVKEMERRQQVEERKRQIWEAEQERKEAILRRNMEREARIEARRNAQRNSQCFAFGSSTPRTFDLDLAAIGIGRNVSQGSVLMSSVSGRRSEERELGPPRATSACSLDRKFGDDCMSRSMVSLSTAFRGRKRTDIMPTLTRERSITPHVTPRGNQCMRAVSMTRLDQLAQPRRNYRELRHCVGNTSTLNESGRTVSSSMSKSMCNLANMSANGRKVYKPAARIDNINMSQSMMHLDGISSQKDTRLTPSPTLSKSSMRSAQSMMHLASVPRLTRAARLRAQALASNRALSAWNLNKSESYSSGHNLSPGKDTSRSPSRPQSSMSGASEISATSSSVSAVNMRPRPAPRRPRPYSIAGSSIDRSAQVPLTDSKNEQERQPRQPQRTASNITSKPQRAKSAGRDKMELEHSKPKKPVPPPKSSEVLARAKSHPVPVKDNLRKPMKPLVTEIISYKNLKSQSEERENSIPKKVEHFENKISKPCSESKSAVGTAEAPIHSPVASPTTDSEMYISSDDSKISAVTESDITTFTQSLTECESKEEDFKIADVSESENASEKKQNGFRNVVNQENSNIPIKFEQKQAINIPSETLHATSVIELENGNVKEGIPSKPRITSEEEARAALAEKRKLAREQAEREAEVERQRQEVIRRQEEEQKRLEELEQKRMEEEQIRLAELHRKLEEEKLRKAIEEQQQREKEEQERREEEARQKAEKEEQDRKVREEAEKQRIELEEKLRKEEEERAERKRRVEQIMARTRGKAAQVSSTSQNDTSTKSETNAKIIQSSPHEDSKTNLLFQGNSTAKVAHLSNGCMESKVEKSSLSNSATEIFPSKADSFPFSDGKEMCNNSPLPDLLNSDITAKHSVSNNGHVESNEQLFLKTSVSNNFTSNRTLSANETTSAAQTNGYSSHEDMSCITSPEEVTDTGLLISIEGSQQKSVKGSSESTGFTKLIDIEPSSFNLNNENYLINVDDVNSNLLTCENTYVGFDDNLQKKKQDSSVTDLLS